MVSLVSLRLRGLEEGGLGGKGLFNLVWEGEEGTMMLGSEGGSFSLEDDLCLREGLDLVELGLDEHGSSAFLVGSMKCFIFAAEREIEERERDREEKEGGRGKKREREGGSLK